MHDLTTFRLRALIGMLSIIYLLRFLLKLLNCSLVNASTFVDQMTGGRRLARVDMTNDDNVYVRLLGTHSSRRDEPCSKICRNLYICF